MECKVPDCNEDVYCKEVCRLHYWRLWKHGDPEYPVQRTKGREPCVVCGKDSHAHKMCHIHLTERLKKIVIWHYSNGLMCCECCGEKIFQFLQIDHLNNDGNIHRKKLGLIGGAAFYRWLIKNNLPEGYQVLCVNCNWGKNVNKGVCPHKIRW